MTQTGHAATAESTTWTLHLTPTVEQDDEQTSKEIEGGDEEVKRPVLLATVGRPKCRQSTVFDRLVGAGRARKRR